MFAFRLDPEAALAQPLDRSVEVGDDHRQVPRRGHSRLLLRHQVHLGPGALEPCVFAQRLRRFDPREPDQLEEADSGLDVSRRNLDPDVMEHRRKFTEMVQLCMFLSATVVEMEAVVLNREEAEMVDWDDRRLEERFRAIDQRFDGVDRRMDEGFARMDAGFRELNGRFDSLQRTLIQIGFGLGAALLTSIAALIGTIATQL